MELRDSEQQFGDKKVDYLIFNSEISLRKGEDGWKINTKFDNHSKTTAEYSHFVTTYKKGESKGWTEQETFLIVSETDHDMQETASDIKFNKPPDNKEYEILVGTKQLNIKLPNRSWYQKEGYLRSYITRDGEVASDRKELNDNFQERQSWSGIWIEDLNESSWIFKDIEIFIEEKKYSRFFCKNEGETGDGCWQSTGNSQEQTKLYRKNGSASSSGEKGTWRLISSSYTSSRKEDDSSKSNKEIEEKVKPIIEKLKGSQGKWMDTEGFCEVADERNISEEQFRDLKMFCAKSRD